MEETEFELENLDYLPQSSESLLCHRLQLPKPLPVQLGWAAPEPRRLPWQEVPQLRPSRVQLQPTLQPAAAGKRKFFRSQGGLLAGNEDGSLLAPALESAHELARYQLELDDNQAYQVKVETTALRLPEPLLEVKALCGCQALRSDHHVLLGRSLEVKQQVSLPELTVGLCLSPHICGEFATLHPTGVRVWDVRRGVPKAWRRRARVRSTDSSSSSGWSGSSSDGEPWEEPRPPDLSVVAKNMEAVTWWRHPEQLVAAGGGTLFLCDLRGSRSSVLFDKHLPLQGLPLYLQLAALERHPSAEHQLLATASGPAQVLLLDVRRPEQPLLRWPLPDPSRYLRYTRADACVDYRALVTHDPLPQQTQAWLATACLGGVHSAVLAWESNESSEGGRLASPDGCEAADVGLLRVRSRPGMLREEAQQHGVLLGCALQALPGHSAPALVSLTDQGDLGLLLLDGAQQPPAPRLGPMPLAEHAERRLGYMRAGGGGPAPELDSSPQGFERAVWWLRHAPAQVASALAAVGLLEEEGPTGSQTGAYDVLLAQRRALQGLWERMPDVLNHRTRGRRALMGPHLQGAVACASSSVAGGQSAEEQPVLPLLDQELAYGEQLAANAEAKIEPKKVSKWKEPCDLEALLLQGIQPEALPATDFAEAYSHRLATVLPLLCIGQPAQGWRLAPPPASPLRLRLSLLDLTSVAYARAGGPRVEPKIVVLAMRLLMRALAGCGLLKCASAWTDTVEHWPGRFFKQGLEAYMPVTPPCPPAPKTDDDEAGLRLVDKLRKGWREQVAALEATADETNTTVVAKEPEPLADAESEAKPKRQRRSGF